MDPRETAVLVAAPGAVRAEPHGLAVVGVGLLQPAGLPQRDGKVEMGFGEIRIKPERRLVLCNGFVQPAGEGEGAAIAVRISGLVMANRRRCQVKSK